MSDEKLAEQSFDTGEAMINTWSSLAPGPLLLLHGRTLDRHCFDALIPDACPRPGQAEHDDGCHQVVRVEQEYAWMKAISAAIHATREQHSSEEEVGFIPGVATAATEATVIGTATAARSAGPARGKLPNGSRPLMVSTKIRPPSTRPRQTPRGAAAAAILR